MEIYKELLKQKEKGKELEISNLSKEDFYFMYIVEGYTQEVIAKLFNTSKNKIENLREKWNIKVTQEFISDKKTINHIYQTFGSGYKYDYNLYLLKEKMGFPKFDDLFIPFLTILKYRKIHNIKEFWTLTDKNYEISEKELEYCGMAEEPTLFYRADWCMDAMIRKKLVQEVELKEYEITKRGEEFLKECIEEKIDKFGLGFLEEKYPDYIEKENIDKEIKSQNEAEKEENKIKEQISNLKEIEYSANTEKRKNTKKKVNNQKVVNTNYTKIDEAKANFGRKCEEIIYNYEKERLRREGKIKNAEEVIWFSKDIGDGAGYDIESFENINGVYEKIYIEVKGTDKDYTEPFEVTINEVMVSEKLKDHYYIYRIAKANTKNPIYYKIKGSIVENFDLTATKFKATRREK